MEKFDLAKIEPNCIMAHKLNNKLSIILGHCDLLLPEVPQENSTCLQRLLLIREAAKQMAKDLNEHECRLDVAIRSAAKKPAQQHSSQ